MENGTQGNGEAPSPPANLRMRRGNPNMVKGVVPEHLRPHVFKPGQSGNPAGRAAGRQAVVENFFALLQQRAPGPAKITYAENLLQQILKSEFLIGKLLDKLLPNLASEPTETVPASFEATLAQIRLQRAAATSQEVEPAWAELLETEESSNPRDSEM